MVVHLKRIGNDEHLAQAFNHFDKNQSGYIEFEELKETLMQDDPGPNNEQLIKDRNKIIRFETNVKLPVVDTITANLIQLLNPNSYQKGSWFLHMLRNKIGKESITNISGVGYRVILK